VAANGQFTWPSVVSFVTVSGQDLMAADTPVRTVVGTSVGTEHFGSVSRTGFDPV
jgi:hypothetical protein